MGSSLPQSLQNMLPQLQQVAHASTSSPSIIVRKARFSASIGYQSTAARASTSLRTEDASDPPRLTHFTPRRAKSYRHTPVARFTLFDPLQLRARVNAEFALCAGIDRERRDVMYRSRLGDRRIDRTHITRRSSSFGTDPYRFSPAAASSTNVL